jgi:hypothetical protein
MGKPAFKRFDAQAEAEVQLETSHRVTFSVVEKSPSGQTVQRSRRIGDLHEVLMDCIENAENDIWLTQHHFKDFNRRKLSVSALCALYVDLDFYRFPALKKAGVREVEERVLERCKELEISYPSVILWSGQGIYLKWYLHPVPGRATPKWDVVQQHLVEKFKDLGADPQARDVSRVLRVIGTRNQKTGGVVQPLWIRRSPGELATKYSFDKLADEILPYTKEEYQRYRQQRPLKKFEKKKSSSPVLLKTEEGWGSILAARQLSFALRGRHVVEDLRVLAVLRGWDKTGIPDGFRNEFVFWLSNHAALALNGAHHKRVYHEIAAELKSLVPHWHMNRIHRCLHSIYKRSKEMMKPTGWVEYQGELWPRLYTPSNETLIERLQITPEEIIQLHYIRSKETEAEQRKRKRQDHGMRSREDYLEQFEPRRKLAVDLREEGKSWQQIGDILGISRSGAYYLVSKGK